MTAPGVPGFFEQERQRILGACNGCGKCFEVCPMPEFLGIGAAGAKSVVRGVLSVVARTTASQDPQTLEPALKWIGGCTGSGCCIPACPQEVNPKMMLRLARVTALGGLGDPKLLTKPEDPNWFYRVRAFAKIQLSDDEQKEWM